MKHPAPKKGSHGYRHRVARGRRHHLRRNTPNEVEARDMIALKSSVAMAGFIIFAILTIWVLRTPITFNVGG